MHLPVALVLQFSTDQAELRYDLANFLEAGPEDFWSPNSATLSKRNRRVLHHHYLRKALFATIQVWDLSKEAPSAGIDSWPLPGYFRKDP